MTRTSCRAIALIVFAVAVAAAAVGQPLTVTSVEGDVITTPAVGEPPEEWSVFDVYAAPDADGVYRALIDSVYFVGLGEDEERNDTFVFQSVWRGGGLYLRSGYHVIPAGRLYSIDTDGVETVLRGSGRTRRSTVGTPFTIGIGGGSGLITAFDAASESDFSFVYGGEVFTTYFNPGKFRIGGGVRFMTNLSLYDIDVTIGYPAVPNQDLPALLLQPGIIAGYAFDATASALVGGVSAKVFVQNPNSFVPGISLDVRIYQLMGFPFSETAVEVSPWFRTFPGTSYVEISVNMTYSFAFGE